MRNGEGLRSGSVIRESCHSFPRLETRDRIGKKIAIILSYQNRTVLELSTIRYFRLPLRVLSYNSVRTIQYLENNFCTIVYSSVVLSNILVRNSDELEFH